MPLFPQGILLQPDSIDNLLLANMAAGTVKGRAIGAGTGDPQDLTQAQLAAMVPLSYRNILGRNGGFEVWQRGAGGGPASIQIPAATVAYTADGWSFYSGTANSQVYQWAGVTGFGLTNGSRWAAVIQRHDGQTGVATQAMEFPLDTDEIALARGSIVTLSFSALGSPTFSPAGRSISIWLACGTGAPVKRIHGAYAGETLPIATTFAAPVNPTVTRFSFTSPAIVPINTTQASVFFTWTPVGTASADYWALDDVTLENGSIAWPFERRPLEQELHACRRHFWKSFGYSVAPAAAAGNYGILCVPQFVGALAGQQGEFYYPVPMRRVPTVAFYNPAVANAQARNIPLGVDCSNTIVNIGNDHSVAVFFVTAAGSAPGHNNFVHLTADAGI